MSISPRCAARSRRSRALVILDGMPMMVDLGMPNLGSCATLVVPELMGRGGEAGEKPPPMPLEAPARCTHTLVRSNSHSSRRRYPPPFRAWGRIRKPQLVAVRRSFRRVGGNGPLRSTAFPGSSAPPGTKLLELGLLSTA
jgi:hypothetical protein